MLTEKDELKKERLATLNGHMALLNLVQTTIQADMIRFKRLFEIKKRCETIMSSDATKEQLWAVMKEVYDLAQGKER